jgi:benzoate-CoA ligase family protein
MAGRRDPRGGPQGNCVDYLFEHALSPENRDRVYLRLDDGAVTFEEQHRRVCQAGHYLKSIGLQPGERMLMSVMDGKDFVALFLGALKIGVVAVPLSTFQKAKDYRHNLIDSGAAAIFVDHSLAGAIAEIRSEVKACRHWGVLGGTAPGFAPFEPGADAQPETLDTRACSPDEVAFWLYSSGSTGAPKGVVHTHAHIYWATELTGIGALGINRDDVVSCPPKMFFALGLGGEVYMPLRATAETLVSPTAITPQRVWAQWIKNRPTVAMVVPTLCSGMLQLAEKELGQAVARRACGRLRFAFSSGEVLPPTLMHRWHHDTGVECLNGFGTTEMTHMFIFNRPGHPVEHSCGRIVEGYRYEILDPQGNRVKVGEVGNLHVHGPTSAVEYWNNPEKTKIVMGRGGVLTGDMVYEDEAGNLFMAGRSDDMLRVGAIWVSPAEVEGALVTHPAVLEAAVIGAPDESGLTKPRAYVTLRDPVGPARWPALEEELKKHVHGQLPAFKTPHRIEAMEELPKTATGKIQRFRLRALALEAGA